MDLIRKIQLPAGQTTWNVGFGCAGILRLPFARQREALLRTAFDCGLTHFDVARMYGAGAAEGMVGRVFQRRRDSVTLATKFGFPCGVPTQRRVLVQSLGRWAVNLHPALKRRIQAGRKSGGDRTYDYSVAEMQRSLEISLCELRTDVLDLFFIHEPRVRDQVPDELIAALQAEVKKGRVRAYGLSGKPDDVLHFLRTRPDLAGRAVQHNFEWADEPAEVRQLPYVGVFHVLAGMLPALSRRGTDFTREWSDRLSIDLAVEENLAIAILAAVLHADPSRMVLFFTSNRKRLARVVHRLRENSFRGEDLEAFREAARSGDSVSYAA